MGNGGKVQARCAVLVGPYGSGKSTLTESLAMVADAVPRRGVLRGEAGAKHGSSDLAIAHCEYLGDRWALVDCPGSIEFSAETENALMAADIAVVVLEPVIDRLMTVAPILRFLDRQDIPHLLFINKMDVAASPVRDVLTALQGLSARPLVLRQVPIRDGETVTGYVDLVSERAYHYRPGQASDLIKIPDKILDREREARAGMLEALADFDDSLLEKLLEDSVPPSDEIYKLIAKDVAQDLIVPVLLGSAERDNGVRRLWKALRHDAPTVEVTAGRKGLKPEGEAVLQVVKTLHASHTGKLSIARVWRGSVKEGQTLNGTRVGGVQHMLGAQTTKLPEAAAGELVALGRMDPILTGQVLTPSGNAVKLPWPVPHEPMYGLSISADNRNEDVKLSGALQKIVEEDPSLSVVHDHDTGETVLWGQGDIHLQAAIDKLARAYALKVTGRKPEVPFKETIRKGTKQHARHKRQSGGHGQFADVQIEIQPQARGAGFQFHDKIVGGAVPRNYIPAVGEGVEDYLKRGPLGYPVVDLAVTLFDGTFHAVDSSDMAFKTAARMAMTEGMAKCDPVALEPIYRVSISVPNDFTPKVQRLITGRRGQLLGFDAKPDWPGWDQVEATMPQAEMHDLIIELRSLTLGVGSYSKRFDHLAEVRGAMPQRADKAHAAAG